MKKRDKSREQLLKELAELRRRIAGFEASETRLKRTEEELKKLAIAITQVIDSVVITDTEGRIQYLNPAFERVTGYLQKEVLGQTQDFLKSGKHSDKFFDEMWNTIKSGKTWKGSITNKKKDGTLYEEDVTISPVRDSQGKIINFVEVKRDVTQRKWAEEEREALRHLSHRLTAPLGVKEVGKTVAGASRLLFGHDAFLLDLFDEKTQKLSGVYYEDTEPGAAEPTEVPVDPEHTFIAWLRDVIGGKPKLLNRIKDPGETPLFPFGYESRLSRSLMYVPIRWEERTVGVLSVQSYTPGRYGDRELNLLQTFADQCGAALARAQAVEELKRTHDIYRKTIENARGMPYYLDFSSYEYVFVGEGCKELLGISGQDLTYERLKSLIREVIITDPEAPSDQKEYAGAFLRSEVEQYRADLRIVTPAGEEKWLSDCSLPIRDEKTGKVVASLGILQDITQRKRDEEIRRIFAKLGLQLAEANTLETLAIPIAKAVDELLNYDAFLFAQRLPGGDFFKMVYATDIIQGKRQVVKADDVSAEIYSPMEKLLEGEPFILNRTPADRTEGWVSFGDESRPSASLMFAPICFGGEVCGLLSAQSYKPQRYGESDVALLKILADSVAPALRRVQAETILRESEEKYRLLVENVNDGIVISQKEKFIFFNCRFAEMLGYEPEELLMKDYREVYTPRSVEILLKRKARRARGEEVPARYETVFRKKDGSEIYVEANVTIIDYRDDLATFAVIRDITRRKQAEKERESLQRLAQRLTGCRNLREVGRAVAQEARRLFGCDAFGFSYLDPTNWTTGGIYHEDTPVGAAEPQEMPTWQTHRIEKTHSDFNKPLLVNREEEPPHTDLLPFGDKSRISRSLMFAPVRWEDKTIGQLTVQSYTPRRYTEKDLNLLQTFANECGAALGRAQTEEERQKLEAQIQHGQKLESLGVLAGGIAHDFNNLLVGILGNASLALMELPPESPARSIISKIETTAERAAELANQMLAYSGKGKFVVEHLNLNKLVEEMAHLLEISILKKIVLKFSFADNLPYIEGDVTQLRQVIMNLITNASDAIGDKSGVIILSTGVMEVDRAYLAGTYVNEELPEGYYVYVEVSDTGCGMDKETKAKIFDPFFSTKFTGRGLGLAAVLGIMRGHGGAIKVYSEPGRGTTFKVLFPRKELPQKPGEGKPAEKPKAAEKWGGTGTVLVVDDEETVRSVSKMILEDVGFNVLTAKDGEEGLDIFREHSGEIVAVLLDLTMPHLGGEDAFREMRRIKSDVHVLLSSGYNEQEATDRFAGKGLAGFIQKPYRAQKLIEKLRRILEN